MTDAAPRKSPGRVAGIDFGTVRIGVAVSDPQRTIASPLVTYTRRGAEADARYFRQLVADERIVLFVVGLPVHLSGRESQLSAAARRFADWLAETTGVEVVLFDERFSTAEAEAMLDAAGLTSKNRRARRDMLAAQILLTAFLESGAQGHAEPGALDD